MRLLALLLMLPWLAGCSILADYVVEPSQNEVVGDQRALLAAVPAEHKARHAGMFIADLHADTLLWGRDMLRRSPIGHVDLPRMADGNLALQVFTLVTDTPRETPDAERGHCIFATERNLSALLTFLEARPPRAWFGLRARAMDQIDKLREAERRSRVEAVRGEAPELMILRDAAGLQRLLARRAAGEKVVGGILGVEGAHWVGADNADEATTRAQVRELFEAGVRVFAPTHRFNNPLGAASEGCNDTGLTQQGRWALLEAESLGMVIDLAHASSNTLRDAVALLRAPMIVSHTGVQEGCADPCYRLRNLKLEEVRAVAAKGGLIGVGYWPEAVGPGGIPDIIRTMGVVRTALRGLPGVVPEEHLALGGDFDGAVATPFDVAGLPALTWAMTQGGFDDAALRAAAGRNTCRVFMTRLPGGGEALARETCANAGR